jgi:hypothetical protein
MRRVVLALSLAVAAAAPVARTAEAAPCEQEAAELRSHLEREARRARTWNTAWAIGFGTAAAAQLALGVAQWNPLGAADRDFEETAYVGAAKATIGLLARVVLPLRVAVPAPAADPCTDVAALRGALADAGRRERRSFWLTHLGVTALNLAGAALLTYRRSLSVGAVSFAISYPVGPLHAYTQPRRSWKRWRAQRGSWTVGATGGAATTLWIGGAF